MRTGLVSQTGKFRIFGAVFAVAALVAPALTARAAQPLSDCSAQETGAARARLLDRGEPRPIFLSIDLLQLAMCEGIGPGSTHGVLEARLGTYVLEVAEFSNAGPLPAWAASARQACPDAAERGKCAVEIYRRRGYQAPSEVPFGKSGGLPFAAFLGHTGDAGHFEITGRAAADVAQGLHMAWSPASLAILQDAARDADFYEWGNPLAHAQTRNDPATGLVDVAHQAKAPGEFIEWSAGFLRKAVAACQSDKPRDALYLMGYALHGIQDLVFHKGITNAEHSFRDFEDGGHVDDSANPAYGDNMARAQRASAALLTGMRQRLQAAAPSCWDRMASLPGGQNVSGGERALLLGVKEKDFGIQAYLEYRRLAVKVRDAMDAGMAQDRLFIANRWIQPGSDEPIKVFVAAILTRVGQ